MQYKRLVLLGVGALMTPVSMQIIVLYCFLDLQQLSVSVHATKYIAML